MGVVGFGMVVLVKVFVFSYFFKFNYYFNGFLWGFLKIMSLVSREM